MLKNKSLIKLVAVGLIVVGLTAYVLVSPARSAAQAAPSTQEECDALAQSQGVSPSQCTTQSSGSCTNAGNSTDSNTGGSTCQTSLGCQSVDNSGEAQSCDMTSSSIVTNYLNPVINFLGAGVGLIVIIMIVIGGIQYSASGGDPNAAAAAKKRIMNAIIALVAFALMYAFLQFIIPGGLFNGS